jgi:hypothetical protein
MSIFDQRGQRVHGDQYNQAGNQPAHFTGKQEQEGVSISNPAFCTLKVMNEPGELDEHF